ncbi:MAG: hypothetical protein GXY76_21725 [Chloroflexi bacterium]|nr:hypothetical protein [Chloroflexota bacterium]
METRAVYYEQGGQERTDETLRLAKERADALGIRDIVVASYSGFTGARAAEVFKGYNLVVVAGVVRPDRDPMNPDYRAAMEAAGAKLLYTGHAFGMLGRAVNRKFNVIQVDELIANVLRLLSEGVKVACEIACMAADAGLIPVGGEVVSIGGTGKGADSAVVLKATNTHTFFDTRILEIICKPRAKKG